MSTARKLLPAQETLRVLSCASELRTALDSGQVLPAE